MYRPVGKNLSPTNDQSTYPAWGIYDPVTILYKRLNFRCPINRRYAVPVFLRAFGCCSIRECSRAAICSFNSVSVISFTITTHTGYWTKTVPRPTLLIMIHFLHFFALLFKGYNLFHCWQTPFCVELFCLSPYQPLVSHRNPDSRYSHK